MSKRIEHDSLGPVEVPSHMLYGAQTARSKENFKVGSEKMPIKLIHALALVKKASAIVNHDLGILTREKMDLICQACDAIMTGELDDNFLLVVWQTGSGTQTNMNVNEVISNYAIRHVKGTLGSKFPIHPNDDVNKSQSSNDVFPTASHIAAIIQIKDKLLPNLRHFQKALQEKAEEFRTIVKIGRTHLMDATPLTLGQEFSGYASQISHGIRAIENAMIHLSEIALGGTAVGTGLNTHPHYALKVAAQLSQMIGHPLISAPNKFEALAAADAIVEMSGALKRVACSMMKIATDIGFLSSGPRCGIGELILPANEPGSSIMPGKVNPTQCESMAMVATQVMGNDLTISISGAKGYFELNVFRPVMIYNLLQSIELISDSVLNFTDKCVIGIKPDKKRIDELLHKSLMLVTALNPIIGYDNAAKIADKAYREGTTLKHAALASGLLTEKQFDEAVDPSKMVNLD